jgi:hypothetical protein
LSTKPVMHITTGQYGFVFAVVFVDDTLAAGA